MSGGHWNYQQWKIEEWGDKISVAMNILAEIEHELDWGYSGDTCAKCAEIRAIKMLCDLFDQWAGEQAGHTWGDRPIDCENCTAWRAKHPRV